MQDEMFWLALAAVAAAICGGLLLMRCRVFRAEKPRAPQRPRPERIAARKSAPRPSAGRADPPPPPPSVVAVPAAVPERDRGAFGGIDEPETGNIDSQFFAVRSGLNENGGRFAAGRIYGACAVQSGVDSFAGMHMEHERQYEKCEVH